MNIRIDVDALEGRVRKLPTVRVSDPISPSYCEERARDSLRARGISLRGPTGTIAELVRYEANDIAEKLQLFDRHADFNLQHKSNGRPNKHSAFRDILVLGCCIFFQAYHKCSEREARDLTALALNLKRTFRVNQSSHTSIEQVRRAEERTLGRFRLERCFYEGLLFGAAIDAAIRIILHQAMSSEGQLINSRTFERDARNLTSLCRTLEAYERHHRQLNSERRKWHGGSALQPKAQSRA